MGGGVFELECHGARFEATSESGRSGFGTAGRDQPLVPVHGNVDGGIRLLLALFCEGNERFSGLELLCLMHVAFQKINPGTTVGVDFSEIWPAAQMMHAARKR